MKTEEHNFRSCTVHFGTIEFFYLPTDAHVTRPTNIPQLTLIPNSAPHTQQYG